MNKRGISKTTFMSAVHSINFRYFSTVIEFVSSHRYSLDTFIFHWMDLDLTSITSNNKAEAADKLYIYYIRGKIRTARAIFIFKISDSIFYVHSVSTDVALKLFKLAVFF